MKSPKYIKFKGATYRRAEGEEQGRLQIDVYFEKAFGIGGELTNWARREREEGVGLDMSTDPRYPSTTEEFGSNYNQGWVITATRWPNGSGFEVEIGYDSEEAKKEGEEFFKRYLARRFNPNNIKVTWYPSQAAYHATNPGADPSSARGNSW